MRFAGGAVDAGSLAVHSLLVMALPCFVLFLCDLKRERERRLKGKDTPWYSAAH